MFDNPKTLLKTSSLIDVWTVGINVYKQREVNDKMSVTLYIKYTFSYNLMGTLAFENVILSIRIAK